MKVDVHGTHLCRIRVMGVVGVARRGPQDLGFDSAISCCCNPARFELSVHMYSQCTDLTLDLLSNLCDEARIV